MTESADKHQQKAAHEGKKDENGLKKNKDNLVPDRPKQTEVLNIGHL